MKRKKRINRILAFILCISMLMNNGFQANSPSKVYAAEFALGYEALKEIIFLVYDAIRLGSVVNGRKESVSTDSFDPDLLNSYFETSHQIFSRSDYAQIQNIITNSMVVNITQLGRAYTVKLRPDYWIMTDVESGESKIINPFMPGTHSIDMSRINTADIQSYLAAIALPAESVALNSYFKIIDKVGLLPEWFTNLVNPFFKAMIQKEVDIVNPSKYYISDDLKGFDWESSLGRTYSNACTDTGYSYYHDLRGKVDMVSSNVFVEPIVQGEEYIYFLYQGNFWLFCSKYEIATGIITPVLTYSALAQYDQDGHETAWQGYDKDNPSPTHEIMTCLSYGATLITELPFFGSYNDAVAALPDIANAKPLNGDLVDNLVLNGEASDIISDTFVDSMYNPISFAKATSQFVKALADFKPINGIPASTKEYDDKIIDAIPAVGASSLAIADEAAGSIAGTDEAYTGSLEYGGILTKILNAIKAIAKAVWSYLEDPMTVIKKTVVDIKDHIITLPQTLIDFKDAIIAKLAELIAAARARALGLDLAAEGSLDPDNTYNRSFFVILSNGFLLLILIILLLLRIFVHCFAFIINIFRIPANTTFLNAGVISGLNYLKTLIIPGIGMSVYNFMLGLCYVILFFSVIGTLRAYVARMKIPKGK